MKTFTAKPSNIEHQWFLIDAQSIVLGRLAVFTAMRLRGKHKPIFTPHMDCGDHIVIINAKKVKLTGRKMYDKKFYWHTGYPGGIKECTMDKIITGPYPERIIIKAIERMMSKGPLRKNIMSKLHVYAGNQHRHEAQMPIMINIGEINNKNIRRNQQ